MDPILIGLAGWGDHDELYGGGTAAKDKLSTYAGHFPVVEVDSSFYAVQSRNNYEKWVKDTPDGFRFLIKAYQGMTGHQRERGGRSQGPLAVRRVLEAMAPEDGAGRAVSADAEAGGTRADAWPGGADAEAGGTRSGGGPGAQTAEGMRADARPEGAEAGGTRSAGADRQAGVMRAAAAGGEAGAGKAADAGEPGPDAEPTLGDEAAAGDLAGLFRAFRESIEPVIAAGKLFAVLFQYPPWFECTRESVETLRRAKAAMGDVPVALEFRHQSWFTPQMRERTLSFMVKEGWIHSICDEPQAGAGSVPTVLQATHPEKTVVRFHGRNVAGWHSSGQPNWRDVRYLYHYNEAELAEWKERLLRLKRETAQTAVIFNNNSGGHAAGNAKQLMRMLGIDYEGLAPRQLDLF